MLTILLLSNSYCYAAQIESSFEPMGCSNAPLGTAWVRDLEPGMKRYHLTMATAELDYSNKVLINTNIAMFGLNLISSNGDLIQILDRSSKKFSSGGLMLKSQSTEELYDIGKAKEVLRQKITAKESQIVKKITDIGLLSQKHKSNVKDCLVSFDDLNTQLQKLRDEIEQHKEELDTLQEDEKKYSPKVFADVEKYKDHTNAIYDPEQTITRIVDYYLDAATIDEKSITICGNTFQNSDIDTFVLSIHSRTDMCPFCCMFLGHKLKEWRKKIPIAVVVTSRQEYRCGFPFITQQPYYRGYSMRSFAWRTQDNGSSLDGIKKIAEDGLAVQYSFHPLEVYNEANSLASSVEEAA